MNNPYINSIFFQKLEEESLNLKTNLRGFFGGKHRTNKYGQTIEFADYREYMLGDDIRKIDWNLYSRFEKHFIKLYTDERQMKVSIYIDGSSSMGKYNNKKGNYAVALAAALGFLGVKNMDKISFNVIKDKYIDSSGSLIGTNKFYRFISTFEDIQFEGDSFISEAILKEEDSGKDGISIIISDFLTNNDWKKAVDYLIYQGKQVLLVQVLSKDEVSPNYLGKFNLLDSESLDMEDSRNLRLNVDNNFIKAYDLALETIQKEIKDFCVSRGADYTCVSTNTPIDKAIFGELLKVGIIG